ncbi:kappaPI-actitoxin-Avd3c-like [Musca domestica]|uniref:KappaPI-actitoxin-Avd3c-like n=1 Tax=Musca domestica TaxID=7370 RepID=A0A9J7D2U8_MUSDO|nr:kappaPI-actitoxin-Avd3c-like [Musca domestica]
MKRLLLITLFVVAMISLASGQSSSCNLPSSVVGICRARMPSWSYNKQSNSCKFFYYGGCRGNANRFPSKESCERQCVKNRRG